MTINRVFHITGIQYVRYVMKEMLKDHHSVTW